MSRIILLAAILMLAGACGGGGGGGGDKVIVVGNQGPRTDHTAVAIVDFNGDGFNDLVAASAFITLGPDPNPDSIDVYLQDAANPGSFHPPVTHRVGSNLELTTLSAVDLQLDLSPDVVAWSIVENELLVMLQQAGTPGDLDSPIAYPMPGGTEISGRHALADINLDGLPDLAAVGGGQVVYWAQDAANPGNFLSQRVLGPGSQDVAISDIDGDGFPDVVTFGFNQGDDTTQDLLWYRQDPMSPGTFLPPGTFDMGDIGGRDLAVADMDGNGRLDLVVTGATSDNFQFDWHIEIFSQDAPGAFSHTLYRSPDLYFVWGGLRVADLNQDGRADLVVSGDRRLYLFYQSATGGFSQDTSIAAPTDQAVWTQAIMSLDTGDLNMDGLDDIAFTNNELFVSFQQASGGFQAPERIAGQN